MPITRLVSASNLWASRKRVIGMGAPPFPGAQALSQAGRLPLRPSHVEESLFYIFSSALSVRRATNAAVLGWCRGGGRPVVGNFGSIHAKPQDWSSTSWPSATNWSRHGGGTMKAALQNYQARMRRVLDHIDRHLDDDLDLETVSGVAAFSKFHFHRQFTATFGLSVHRYVQLARMKRASYRLAYRDAESVTDIA